MPGAALAQLWRMPRAALTQLWRSFGAALAQFCWLRRNCCCCCWPALAQLPLAVAQPLLNLALPPVALALLLTLYIPVRSYHTTTEKAMS